MPLKDLFYGSRKKDKDKPPPATTGVVPAPNGPATTKQAPPKDPVLAMFDKYREHDEDKIGPDGIMLLCQDLQIDPTDVTTFHQVKLLILAWRLNAETQGYFTRVEWTTGMSLLRADSPSSLAARLSGLDSQLRGGGMTRSPPFKEFYRFSFRFSRTPGQKALEIDTVKALLAIVMPPGHPHVQKLIDFFTATPSIRCFLNFPHRSKLSRNGFD